MPAPIIEALDVLYPQNRGYLLPGESAVVTATVTDPSGSTAEVTVTVTDTEGHVTTGSTTVLLNDTLDIGAELREMDHDAGWTLTPSPTNPARWIVTAPG